MASQMVVPASKDTLFMRGFSARREIDEIRDFFAREGGRCTVEFFKESDDKSKLYVALKFDSKDVAKELLNKYDNTDVLGDRITISWFKDLRRARMKAGHQRRRFNWSPDRYNRNKGYHGGGGGGGRFQHRWNNNNFGTRGRKFERSSSRSRSRSSSRSISRSPSPRRSRSRSNDSHVEIRKHKRSRTLSDPRKEEKRSSEKSKRALARERQSRDRSESRGDSLDEDEDEDMRQSPEPQSRSIKIIRSAVTTVDRPPHTEALSDDESDDPGYGKQDADKDSIDTFKNDRRGNKLPEKNNQPPPARQKKDPNLTPEAPRRGFKDSMQQISEGAPDAEMDKDQDALYRGPEKDKEPAGDRFFHNRRYERDMSPPGHPMDRPPPQAGSRFTDKGFREVEYAGRNFDHRRRSMSPPPRPDEHVPRAAERGPPPAGDFPDSPQHLREREGYNNYRGNRPDPRYEDSPRDLPAATPPPMTRGRGHPDTRDIREPDQSPDTRPPGRVKRLYDDEYERKGRDYDEPRGPVTGRRGEPDDYLEQPKRPRRYEDGPPPIPRDMWRERDYYEDRPGRMDRPPAPATRGREADRDRSPFFDDRESTGTASSRNPPPAATTGGQHSFNGSMVREMEKGALGLPQDKMNMVREKKEEIEKSYRQDCETFAAVAKMLISKDMSLEEKLQSSLRENLKDIGQRCIHELRDFVERLKAEDERRPLH